jgi:hypothetical protein
MKELTKKGKINLLLPARKKKYKNFSGWEYIAPKSVNGKGYKITLNGEYDKINKVVPVTLEWSD